MPADTNSAAPTSSTTLSGGSAAITGAGYSAQAADIAGTDERPGADGGRGTPTHDAQPTTDGSSGSSGSSEEDVAALKAALKAARAEAAATRKKAQELDDLKQQLEDAKLSETEKLQKQLADAQNRAMRAEMRAAAKDLGIKPELALKLIDPAAITFDKAGDPTNISELLTAAIEDFGLTPVATTAQAAPASATSSPAKPAVTSGGATSPARSTSGANGQNSLAAGEWTDARIASLTRDEYLANRASINAWRQKRGRGDGYRW